ncbi:MAG: phosphopantetheine-binding protein [Telluria sp.]
MKTTLLILACIGLCIVLARFESWHRDRKIEAAFKGRESLNPQQFYERYFETKGVPFHIVAAVRTILEDQLSVDMSQLRDNDDFTRELRFFWAFDSMASVQIVLALEQTFDIKIDDAESERSRTVSDIVFLVHSKIVEKSAADSGAALKR